MNESTALLSHTSEPARYHNRRPWTSRLKRLLRSADIDGKQVDDRSLGNPLRITEPKLASLTPNLIDLSETETPNVVKSDTPELPFLKPRASSLFSGDSFTRLKLELCHDSFDFGFETAASPNTSLSTAADIQEPASIDEQLLQELERELRFQTMILRELKEEVRAEKEKNAFLLAKLCEFEKNLDSSNITALCLTVSQYKDTCRRLYQYKHPQPSGVGSKDQGGGAHAITCQETTGFSCKRASPRGLPHLIPIRATSLV